MQTRSRSGTYDQEITYFDPGDETKNKSIGWVDSDFGSDVDSRKSMTGFLRIILMG
jgi:hypothetical protein